MNRKKYVFSLHFMEKKEVGEELAIDCLHHGRRKVIGKNKVRSLKSYIAGELVVIWRELDGKYFIITAFWNQRGNENERIRYGRGNLRDVRDCQIPDDQILNRARNYS